MQGPTTRSLMILIAGPYLSGTDGDPQRIAANLARMESYALPLYERGHLAMIGEWVALPVIHAAGGQVQGDEVFHRYQYPVAQRLLAHCDAVLRIPGASRGADQDVARARELGLTVYERLEDVPMVAPVVAPVVNPA